MEINEQKKDSKYIQISKNNIICGLVIVIVLMAAAAIGFGVSEGEHGDHNGREKSEMVDDHNMNPNDGETQDDGTPTNTAPVSGQTTVTVPAGTAQ